MWILGAISALALATGWATWLKTEQNKRKARRAKSLAACPPDDITTPHWVAELDPAPKRSELELWWEKLNSPPKAPPKSQHCGRSNPHPAHAVSDSQVCGGTLTDRQRDWEYAAKYHLFADDQIVKTFQVPMMIMDNGCTCGPGEDCLICRTADEYQHDRCGCDRCGCLHTPDD